MNRSTRAFSVSHPRRRVDHGLCTFSWHKSSTSNDTGRSMAVNASNCTKSDLI